MRSGWQKLAVMFRNALPKPRARTVAELEKGARGGALIVLHLNGATKKARGI